MPAVALIVLVRDQPETLDLCLASLHGQDFTDFEVLLAGLDDSLNVHPVVQRHREALGSRLKVVKALGERPNRATRSNTAILSTNAEYLVFMEEGSLAQPDFVSCHVEAAEYSYFVHGEGLLLDEAIVGALNDSVVLSAQAFDPDWLRAVSPNWHKSNLEPSAKKSFRSWFRKDTPDQPVWCHAVSSCFRDDALKMNGFDMGVADDRQDRDMGNRFMNMGMQPSAVAAGGNVLTASLPASGPPGDGRDPAKLEAGGEVRAQMGIDELRAAHLPG